LAEAEVAAPTNQVSASYTLLRLRADHPDHTSDQLAARFSSATGQTVRADAVRQKLRRARLRFADLVRDLLPAERRK
jgi:hypothetical protein